MTQPQAQQVDNQARETHVLAAQDFLRGTEPGSIFKISFRGKSETTLWLLVKNDRFDLTIMSLEDGTIVVNKLALFATMISYHDSSMTMEIWE